MLNSPSLIRNLVARYPEVIPHLSMRARLLAGIKAGISGVNREYHDAITEALVSYFENGGSVATPKSKIKQAMVEAFGSAFDTGWQDGGQELPADEEALSWFNERVDAEMGFIDTLLQDAKELRKDKDFDYFAWVTARADGYTNNLSAVYNAAVMFANTKQMLTWRLGETEKHCSTCAKLDGQRHKASWYIIRNYIPRKAGAAMECGGYNCDCSLVTDNGEEVTI